MKTPSKLQRNAMDVIKKHQQNLMSFVNTSSSTSTIIVIIIGKNVDGCLLGCTAPCSLAEVYRHFRSACRAIDVMMEAASISKTRLLAEYMAQYNQEDSHLPTRRHNDLSLIVI
jgi:hypothetical protein